MPIPTSRRRFARGLRGQNEPQQLSILCPGHRFARLGSADRGSAPVRIYSVYHDKIVLGHDCDSMSASSVRSVGTVSDIHIGIKAAVDGDPP